VAVLTFDDNYQISTNLNEFVLALTSSEFWKWVIITFTTVLDRKKLPQSTYS